MVRIEILSGPEAGAAVELGPGRHVLGRAPGSALRIQSETVSSRHLELEVGGDGLVRFQDLGSTNGTFSGGLRVQQGEWFAGSELRLGSVRLRLLAPEQAAAMSAAGPAAGGNASSEENAEHRRAVEKALAGKGGGLKLVLAAVVVAAAAGAYWFFFHGRGASSAAQQADSGAGTTPAGPVQDWIEDRGQFRADDAGAWALSGGLRLSEGQLQALAPSQSPVDSGRGRAELTPSFPVRGQALAVDARLAAAGGGGWRAWAEVEWGTGAGEAVTGRAVSAALGEQAALLPLPASAEWFRLALLCEGAGTLRELSVRSAAGAAAQWEVSAHEGYTLERFGANLSLVQRDGSWSLRVCGPDGRWTPVAGGADCSAAGGASAADGAWTHWVASPQLLDDGPFLLLSEGGPVALAPGVRADACPGLLLGGNALLVHFDPPAPVEALADGLLVRTASARLRWDLSQGFAEAARLVREIDNAKRGGDSRALLALSAQLLRDWPLREEDVEKAMSERRAVLLEGRRRMSELDVAVGEALYLGAASGMVSLQRSLEELAAGLPGTDVAREASAAAELLAQRALEVGREEAARAAAYHVRLAAALERSYPLLAAWVRRHEGGA